MKMIFACTAANIGIAASGAGRCNLGCLHRCTFVPADEYLFGFLLLTSTLYFQLGSGSGLDIIKYPTCSNTCSLAATKTIHQEWSIDSLFCSEVFYVSYYIVRWSWLFQILAVLFLFVDSYYVLTFCKATGNTKDNEFRQVEQYQLMQLIEDGTAAGIGPNHLLVAGQADDNLKNECRSEE